MGHERRLSSLLQGAAVRALEAPGADPCIRGISLDSRQVGAGYLFCALEGRRLDGHRFVVDALARGAVAVLSERSRSSDLPAEVVWVRVSDARRSTGRLAREWHRRPDEDLTLIGITGTNGKTTVTYLVEAMASAAGKSAGRMGTVGYAFAGSERPAVRTTPEAPELYAMLDEMRRAGVALVAMEVSSHALALGRVEGARFAVGAFLNFSRDHLDFHGHAERYFADKARLIEGLGDASTAVLNGDDPRIESLSSRSAARVVRFGRGADAAVRIVDEQCTLEGTRLTLETPAERTVIESPLIGGFAPDNLAAAAACALAVGLDLEAVRCGAARLAGVPGRMERIARGQPFAVFVDYAHTDQALARLLSGLRGMLRGRLLVLFGCGGERDPSKRPAMGRVAAEQADLVVLTSDNPRGEDPLEILRDIRQGVREVRGAGPRCRVLPDRRLAIRDVLHEARAGDAVVLAGKGHESTQTTAAGSEPFDDRQVAREALAELGYAGGCHAGA